MYANALQYQIDHRCDALEAERLTIGIDHNQISQSVVQRWNFPEEMQTAIADISSGSNEPLALMACVVHLAEIFSLALDFSEDETVVVPAISELAWKRLNFSEPACLQIFLDAETAFQEISQILIA